MEKKEVGLVEGLKDSRPNELPKDLEKTKVLSAKEKRRIRAEANKKRAREKKQLELIIENLEKEILKLEEEQSKINIQLVDPDSYNNPEKAKELNEQASRILRRLKEKNYEWEIETDKLSELQG